MHLYRDEALKRLRRRTGVTPPWLEFLEGSLAEVEALLQSEVESRIRSITGLCQHCVSAGGKRFRPALVVLGALAADPDADVTRPIQLAAGVELLHLATLMHDDVVDGADSRRGAASANALSGNKVSVLVGDYLFARSFGVMARDGDDRIIKRMATVTVALAEGEVLELVMRGSLGELESQYWHMIDLKTARLISACTEVGGICVDAPDDIIESLARYGERIGLVFQMTDDLLDLVGDRASVGKPVGADLLDGKVTLPYILALREISPEVRESLLEKAFQRRLTPDDVHYLTQKALELDVAEHCLALAEEQVEIASKHLANLPATPAKSVLEEIGPYLLERSS